MNKATHYHEQTHFLNSSHVEFSFYPTLSYRLLLGQHVAGTTNEDSTSGLANHNNQDFTTVDRDNDGTPFNCAETNQGGWWYSNCGLANFNSRLPPKYNIGIISYRSADRYYSPIFVEIKMRLL